MIKSSFGSTQMQGSVDMILTDFSCITDSLKNFLTQKVGMDEETAKAAIKYAFEIGFMSKEERNQAVESLEQQMKPMMNDFGELFGILAEALKGGASE